MLTMACKRPFIPDFQGHNGCALYGTRGLVSISSRAVRLIVVSWLAGCAGAGPYGFSRTYEPLPSEQRHFEDAHQLSYQDVIREPNAYKNEEVSWFGVVQEVRSLPDGRARVLLTLRTHQPRHLCANESRSSCRVTVSEAQMGPFTAELKLNEEEQRGKDRVWVGSLLKIYGKPTGEYDKDSGPVFDVVYHRHWPRGTYVTTAQRSGMRR